MEIAPFQPEAVDHLSSNRDGPGLPILATSVVSDRSKPITFVLLDGNGEVTDFLRLGHLIDRNETKKVRAVNHSSIFT